MENASKALIIAGAILLAILIIGIGVYIYQGAAGTIHKANLSSQEINQYNSEFLAYEGENVSGTQAMALCDVVKQHNLANQTDLSKQISVSTSKANESVDAPTGEGAATQYIKSATDTKKGLRAGYTYKITYGYDSKTGFITAIGIEKN